MLQRQSLMPGLLLFLLSVICACGQSSGEALGSLRAENPGSVVSNEAGAVPEGKPPLREDSPPSMGFEADEKPASDEVALNPKTPPRLGPPTLESPRPVMEEVLKVVQDKKGRHTAQVLRRGDKQLVLRDGRPGPEYDRVGEVAFSEDGSSLAYEALRGEERFLVVDGQELPLKATIFPGSLRMSPDNKRLALVAQAGSQWQVLVDGRPGPPFDFVFTDSVKFSPDAKRFGYLALKEAKLQVVVDHEIKRELDILAEGTEVLADTLSLYEESEGEKKP